MAAYLHVCFVCGEGCNVRPLLVDSMVNSSKLHLDAVGQELVVDYVKLLLQQLVLVERQQEVKFDLYDQTYGDISLVICIPSSNIMQVDAHSDIRCVSSIETISLNGFVVHSLLDHMVLHTSRRAVCMNGGNRRRYGGEKKEQLHSVCASARFKVSDKKRLEGKSEVCN